MTKKIIGAGLLIFLLAVLILGWREYRDYQERREARLRRAQEQQIEEVQVTIIEGWTVKDIANHLEKQGLVNAKDFIGASESVDLTNHELVKRARLNEKSLEGFLFPDTYRFIKQATSQAIIDRMLDNFEARLGSLGVKSGQGRYAVPGYETLKIDGASGLHIYELLTLASIVEKESGGANGIMSLEEQRKIIAGIFYNRLLRGQALQADSTVNYATGKSTPAASSEDLQINSPYNTYKYPGLPPGPIANPSLSSIRAVLYPTKTDYNYFFHKQPSGEVVFSKTFDEHRRRRIEAGQ
jgi:UPF0755 protein